MAHHQLLPRAGGLNMFIELCSTQIEALVSMNEILQHDRWALIGASAIQSRLPMQRATVDVDFAVTASGDSIHARLSSARLDAPYEETAELVAGRRDRRRCACNRRRYPRLRDALDSSRSDVHLHRL
jgi:hypothetical protein